MGMFSKAVANHQQRRQELERQDRISLTRQIRKDLHPSHVKARTKRTK